MSNNTLGICEVCEARYDICAVDNGGTFDIKGVSVRLDVGKMTEGRMICPQCLAELVAAWVRSVEPIGVDEELIAQSRQQDKLSQQKARMGKLCGS